MKTDELKRGPSSKDSTMESPNAGVGARIGSGTVVVEIVSGLEEASMTWAGGLVPISRLGSEAESTEIDDTAKVVVDGSTSSRFGLAATFIIPRIDASGLSMLGWISKIDCCAALLRLPLSLLYFVACVSPS